VSQPPRPIDSVDALRRNPTWYFPSGEFDAGRFLSLVREEIRSQDPEADPDIRYSGGWWLVAADRDWLHGDTSAFLRLVPLPGDDANASRVEVLLYAFCPVVVTAVRGDVFRIRDAAGAVPPTDLVRSLADQDVGRAILFKEPTSRGSSPVPETAGHRSDRVETAHRTLAERSKDYLHV
jgi:hypothetical protein